MKKIRFIILSPLLALMLLGFSMQAHAALENLGVDDVGSRLIYDSDLDITWYDYTNTAATWQSQMAWADALSVNFGDNVFDDWRLPETVDTTLGVNKTGNEMGHLFYTELGNTVGTFSNPGDFRNLESDAPYWTGTMKDSIYAWNFVFLNGYQGYGVSFYADYNAIAVHSGNLASTLTHAPEPVSSILFVVGAGVLGFRRFRK